MFERFRWKYRKMPIAVVGAATAASGALYVSNDDGVFVEEDGFKLVWSDNGEKTYRVQRLHADPWGGVYYTSRATGVLFRKPPDRSEFYEVAALDGVTRGFEFHPSSKKILLGKYGQAGPAQLLSSTDGEKWDVHAEWDAKHIHDVRVNPSTGWLYVAVGEGAPTATTDSHALYRSKDGNNFTKIFQANPRRPLIFPINFLGDQVLMGTDHPEGGNYLFVLKDDGEEGMKDAGKVLDFPYQDTDKSPAPFPYFMEWFDGQLLVGLRGKRMSCLLSSRDLTKWEILDEVRSGAIGTSFTAATRGNGKGRSIIISGDPGRRIDLAWRRQREFPRIEVPVTSFIASAPARVLKEKTKKKEKTVTKLTDGWGLSTERQVQTLLDEHDPKLKEELSKGYFYRANPLFYNKVHMRETLAFLLSRSLPSDAGILDYATGTGQFLLYLWCFGFRNLHGWDQNKRWLDAAAYLFSRMADEKDVHLRKVERPAIYDIRGEAGQKFDVITMFALIYGHNIDVPKTLKSVSMALHPGGVFVANDKNYAPEDVKNWLDESGLKLLRKLTIESERSIENHVYFAVKK